MTSGCVAGHCSCSNTPLSLQCRPELSADTHRHHHQRQQQQQQQQQPVYCQLTTDAGVDDSLASGSIDVQFQSSATSTMTSDAAHPLPQLSRWKPVSNIPERWSREILHGSAAAGHCEFVTYTVFELLRLMPCRCQWNI